jgi:hypothetical protein
MTSTLRTHAHLGSLSVLTAAAVAAALAAAPATAAKGTTAVAPTAASSPPSAPGAQLVTLVTGDRVVLRHDGNGHTTASLAPGSPHYGGPVEHVAAGTHAWVVPKLAPSVRSRLDPSLFDVSALAARSGRVPLTVTFAPGTSARDLPGIDVRTTTARRSAGGRTAVTASYDAHRPLPARLAGSLAGVSRIAVAGATDDAAQLGPSYELHTLTINGTTSKGAPLPGADVFVMNLDDARLFAAFGGIVDGQWKVSVPSGTYLIIADDFSRTVVHTTSVTGDTTTSLSLADATVKSSMTLPGYQNLSPSLDIVATDASHHGGLDFGYSGFRPRLNPVAALPVGTLTTEVGDLWTAKGYEPFSFDGHTMTTHPIKQVVAAKEVVHGIPRHLTFHYRPSDFAKVAIQHYATGPQEKSYDGWYGWSGNDEFAFIDTYPSTRPGVIHAMFQGGKDISWGSYTSVNASFRSFTQLSNQATYRAGQHASVPFFRGPVTPVVDRGQESGGTGPRCALCVKGGVLHGFMSMMSSAGTQQLGFTDHGTWQLYGGRTRLQHGGFAISPYVKGVAPGTKLTLVAQTTPPDSRVKLSSKVTDVWTATMPGSDRVVPILRADYVPPTTLQSVATHRQESFPVTFDNLGPVDARVARASVSWSVNGTWHAASVKRVDANTFHVSYRNPAATAAHPYVSLRLKAQDQAGRSLVEQVQNAYVLPRGVHAATSGGRPHRDRFQPNKLCRTTGTHQYRCFVKLNAATRSAGRAAPDPAGWGAPALRDAYDLTGPSADTTVAVVVAYDYPSAEADMNKYRRQFGLPACTRSGGCFTKINQNGQAGHYPEQDYGWGVEASLDLQMISTACPTCHIVLVEANQPTDRSLGRAEAAAVNAGATVTNHSFGRIELTGTDTQASQYDHAGVTAVASTGDDGYGPASFPASSPDVVAVGGTTLARSSTDPRGWTEKAWAYAGSGCSAYFGKVTGQADTACHGRTEGDVSAVARGLAIYNTSLPKAYKGWLMVDGTSASSPLIAGIIGASGSDGLRPADLYAEPGVFNDVVGGANGFCQGSYLCTAVPGYDGPTGLGTPEGGIPRPPA